jgi:hypothetical protein
MKNCTNHFLERWVERVVGITTEKEKKEYITKNKQMITEHANESFERSDFIWKGQLGDNITRHYYLMDDIVFITNTSDDALITTYKVDLGFTEDLNRTVRRGLVLEVKRLREEKENIELQILEEVEEKFHQADNLEEEIKIMELQLANIKKQREFLKEEAKMLQSKSLNTGLELKKYTIMLVNSKEYKDDLRTSTAR